MLDNKIFMCYDTCVRIDKFLKVSRILKRRAVAKDACGEGKVFINGHEAKPSKQLAVGDKVKIEFRSGAIEFVVRVLNEKASKDEATTLYEIIS